MREILFRAKRANDGAWEFGWFEKCSFGRWPLKCSIIPSDDAEDGYYHHVMVSPETVGQFTGLTDKNGKKIFEGDIVNVWWEQRTLEKETEFPKYKAVIEFGNPNHLYSWGFQLKKIDDMPFNPDILLWVDMEETGAFIEVIGNIHDNPELLEG